MTLRILKLMVLVTAVLGAAIFISAIFRRSSDGDRNSGLKISTSTPSLKIYQPVATTSENAAKVTKPKAVTKTPEPITMSPTKDKISSKSREVSPKSFEELINSSVVQLYCGYLNDDKTNFSDIARGTGIVIDASGRILTNRHIIYDENLKKTKNDCFVLKSPFPNSKSEKPKIYYSAEIISYPLAEKFDETFSKDKYYNDFAVLKIDSRPENMSIMSNLLQTIGASESDYKILEPISGVFNFLPIDWDYQPKNNDELITLGYGVDATHLANQITSTIGRLSGNIDINKSGKPQILLIESNSTAGFSGGALINPKSKGFVGLISWITSGDETGKYTVAIFRDFLKNLMLQDLNFDLK